MVTVRANGQDEWKGPGQVGGGKDTAKCAFCRAQFAAQVDRILAHAAGETGHKAALCTGVKKGQDESREDYEKRVDAFKAARERCKTLLKAKAAKKNENNEIKTLEVSSAGMGPCLHARGTARVFVLAR